MADSKFISYVIGAVQIVAGIIISIVSWGTLGPLGVSLIVSGVATIIGTALSKPAGADGGSALRSPSSVSALR